MIFLWGEILFAWLLFAACHVEEPRSLVRGWISPVEESSFAPALRLVTLNCGGGQAAALADLKPLRPDVIFLQEPPPRLDVEDLVRDLFSRPLPGQARCRIIAWSWPM